ncbi:MAG: carboxypeptidase regulatory-like domain-containing protein, partial [Acidobacteriota bacterium]|nr:carboxypeptidase regulatory-like domain-containing protein [Acidobacteriota bacterium]
MLIWVGVVSVMLFCCAPIGAQTSSASIAGNIRDAQDAAISTANVTITEQSKNVSTVTKADESGRFVFPQLAPGKYDLVVESPGFKKLERKDIELLANDKISVGTITLDVGAVTESIEVQAQVVQLKTESAERSDAIVGKQLQNLAVNSRSYLQLAGIVPGVVSTNNLSTGGVGGLSGISANGVRQDQNNLTLDGIENVDTGSNGGQLASISLDSVQEFKILTSNYQAEYGRSSGAQISVVSKSGTSQFHGSGYLFHRNESLNANNWKNNRDGLPRNLFRFNDPGYTIGGPVFIPKIFNTRKDKLFFFFSQEFQQQLRPEGRRDATFPTALERMGDFSQSVDKNGNPFPYIHDPLSELPCSASNSGGCFAAGGVVGRIPANRLYAPGVAILNFFPMPNQQSAANKGFNFQSQIPDSYPRRETLIRGDYNLSEKWKIFSRYIDNKDGVTSPYGSFVLGSGFPIVPISDVRPGYNFGVSATTIINPTMTNEATFGIGHNKINIDAVNNGLTRAKTGINVPLLYPDAVQQDYIPRFAYAGSRIGNEQRVGSNDAPFINYNTTLDWIDNLSKVWRSHVFKAGVYIERSRKDQTSFANFNGDINFGDNSSNPLDTGFGFANMAVGVFSTYNQASKFANGMYRYTNAEWYLQDQWKLTRKLTLDYGMRFEWIQPQFDAGLQTATFLPERFDPSKAPQLYRPAKIGGVNVAIDPITNQTYPSSFVGKIVPNSGNLLNGIAQAGKDVSKYLVKNRGVHYSPRFGFAYDVTGRQQFVVRAGGAIFYDRFQGNEVFDMLTNPPTTFAPTLLNGFLKDVDP